MSIQLYDVSRLTPVFDDYLNLSELPTRHIVFIEVHPYSPYKYSGMCFALQNNTVTSYEIPYEECWWVMESNGEDRLQAVHKIATMEKEEGTQFIYKNRAYDDRIRLHLKRWYQNPQCNTFIGLSRKIPAF